MSDRLGEFCAFVRAMTPAQKEAVRRAWGHNASTAASAAADGKVTHEERLDGRRLAAEAAVENHRLKKQRVAMPKRMIEAETATIAVDAPNQRNAAFTAAQQAPEWQQQSTKVEVDDVEGAAE